MEKFNRCLITAEHMAEILADCVLEDKEIYIGAPDEKSYIKDCAYIVNGVLTFHLYTIYEKKTLHFYTYKDGRDIIEGVPEGSDCYRILARHYWKPEITYKETGLSASPLLGYNPKYNGTRRWAISYDLNSAYGSVILKGWIDTTQPPQEKIVEEDEIGFELDLSDIVSTGEFSMFVFKKCAPPEGLVKFINVWYDRKKNAKNKKEKTTAKNMLNHIVGCLQGKNFWLRAYVVANCNRFILDRLDENSLYWNTDCIISSVRRPDLEENLGLEIGQWKIDHEGLFAYRGHQYQWNYEKPTWRSVPKEWIPENYDILNDENQEIVETNVWFFSLENMTFYKKEGLE